MLSPRRVKLLDKIDDIASIPVGTAKVIPEVLVGIDRERRCPFLSERREKEDIATFPDSLAISIGSHPLENADRLDFVYSHIIICVYACAIFYLSIKPFFLKSDWDCRNILIKKIGLLFIVTKAVPVEHGYFQWLLVLLHFL